jgi:hypothetical protein
MCELLSERMVALESTCVGMHRRIACEGLECDLVISPFVKQENACLVFRGAKMSLPTRVA